VASDAAGGFVTVAGSRILVVDDEVELRRALKRALEGHGYVVREAGDGAAALSEFAAFKPDVVLLDLMLPDMTGVEVCQKLRETAETPIIVLSVVDDEQSKIAALDHGADDYLTKPFGTGELLARLRVALRRGSTLREQKARIETPSLSIDLERREIRSAGKHVHLTPTEYSLLKYLVTHPDKVLTHPMILRAVWGPEYAAEKQLLRTYVNQLREKLGDAAGKHIVTDPGVGYRFTAEL
jgi:two-component system, OmpR family, KDP operon response regulator KdpE